MISIIVFPGSNCDRDLKFAIQRKLKIRAEYIWHKVSHIKKTKLIFIPGGFSFGDHLRAGILAAKSPAVKEIVRFSKKGVPIVGICNGFQILTESKLLPGTLMKNVNRKFICEAVNLKVNNNTIFSKEFKKNQIIKFPIAHAQGNYYADELTLKEIDENGQIVFRYCSENGEISQTSNPNGSKLNIAGIVSRNRKILGLMPHPERAIGLKDSSDGNLFFKSLMDVL